MALGDRYGVAYFFFLLFGVFLICFWFTSDFLLEQRNRYIKCQQKNQQRAAKAARKTHETQSAEMKELSLKRKWLLWKYGMASVWVLFTLATVGETRIWEIHQQLQELHGVLLPANDADPPGRCGDQYASDLKLYLGTSTFVAKKFPYSVFTVESKTNPQDKKTWLSLDKDNKGNLTVSAEVRGNDGKLIATISRNELEVNGNRIFRNGDERPDQNTLSIKDEYGNEVLYIRYLNRHSIKLRSLMFFGPSSAFRVSDDLVHVDGTPPLELQNDCIAFENDNAITVGIMQPQ